MGEQGTRLGTGGCGLSYSSCCGEPGRQAPPVTAPHETLTPGRRTAISRHLEPMLQPWNPATVGGQAPHT